MPRMLHLIYGLLCLFLTSSAFAGGHTSAQSQKIPETDILIHAGSLLDMAADDVQKDVVIVVKGDRIAEILSGSAAEDRLKQTNSDILDLTEYTVLPGLMDAHVHLTFESGMRRRMRYEGEQILMATQFAERTLMAGFTTVRDLASGPDNGYALREVINQGEIVGPRIVNAGLPVTAAGGHGDFPGRSAPGELHDGVCWDEGSCRNAVRIQIKRGADVIKLMATGGFSSGTGLKQQLFFEEMKAAIDAAHQRGVPVASHAYARNGIMDVVKAGVDSVEHGLMIDAGIAQEMARRGTTLTPTLMVYQSKDGKPLSGSDAVHAKMSEESFRNALAAGVTISFGTDAGVGNAHGSNAREFTYMVEHGMSPLSALKAATVNNAKLFQLENDLGTIEEGKLADIIAVKGDPLEDISILKNVSFVMKEGAVVKPLD